MDPRRILFIEQIEQKTEEYKKMYDEVAFYYYGNDGEHGNGYYYPLYLSQQPGTEKIQFQPDQIFFIEGDKRGVPFVDRPGLIDYKQYEKPYLPIDFMKDDIIKVRLTYHPSDSKMYNKNVYPRSYMIYIKLI